MGFTAENNPNGLVKLWNLATKKEIALLTQCIHKLTVILLDYRSMVWQNLDRAMQMSDSRP